MKTISIRASSLATLFDCAYSWEGTHLMDLKQASNGRMHLGSALHQSTAIMDIMKKDGKPIDFNGANDLFEEAFTSPEYDVVWEYDDLNKRHALDVGFTLNQKYREKVTNTTTFESIEKQIGSVVIEVSQFNIAIELTGKLDRSRSVLGIDGRDHGIVDLKSGKTAVGSDGIAKTKGHAAQIGVYELLQERTTKLPITLPARIIGLQTSKKSQIGFGTIHGAKNRVLGTSAYPGYLEMAAQMFKSGLFPPNPRSMLCKSCARRTQCPYKD